MDIVIADAAGAPVRQTDGFDLDVAYGDDENRFTLGNLAGPPLEPGWRWWVDGSPYGGIVDTVCPSSSAGAEYVSYKGRCAHGVMAGKVLEPDAGQSHLVVSGDANAIISALLERCGLDGWGGTEDSGIEVESYRFHRYIDLWSGLRMMLASVGARPKVEFVDGSPVVTAVRRDTYGDVPSELVDFSAERAYRPVNHLIGLGTGEGAAREVSHWYADASGAVSQTQSLFGADEVAETYDLSSESDDLPGKTRSKLEEYQGEGTFDSSLPEGAGLDVGDLVAASSASTGIRVEAEVVKAVLKVSQGVPSVSYEVGSPTWPDDNA